MAPEIAGTIKDLEAIINKLNNLQMDECGTAKEMVSALVNKGDFEASGGIFSEVSGLFDNQQALKDGTTKNRYQGNNEQSGGDPINDQKKSIDGCSQDFKDLYTKEGSFLDHVASKNGLESYASYMRAYIGDVQIKKTSSDKLYKFIPVGKCPNMDVTKVDDIILGNAKIRPAGEGSTCEKSNDVGLIIKVENKLTAIANKIRERTPFTTDEKSFLNAIPYDIHGALARSVTSNSTSIYIDNFKHTIARLMAYALIDDLIDNIRSMIKIANNTAMLANKSGDAAKSCEPLVVAELLTKVASLKKDALELQKAARLARRENIKEVNNNVEFNKTISNK
jgi:hypothetical protein